MKNLNLKIIILLLLTIVIFNSCKKNKVDPSIDGTWIEIDNTTTQNPTGCELVIDKIAGDVTLCGFTFVHPNNVAAATNRRHAKLFIKDGQMYYRQKDADLLWIVAISKEDLYFIDYDLVGKYLWIKGDNSKSKTSAIGVGKVFIKK